MVETMGDEKRNEAMPISNDSWQSGNTMTGVGEVGFAEALAIARNLPSLKEVEPLVIEEALKRADGNQTIAARLLDISRQALHNRLNRSRKLTDEI